MEKRWFTKKLTLLVIRDADQAVKQVDVSKLLIVAVPIAAVVSISSFIVGLEIRSAQEIQGLQNRINTSAITMDVTVKDKDQAIAALQNEIVRLSSNAEETKDRIQNIHNMENSLQQLINKYGKDQPPQTAKTDLPWDATEDMGGEYFPVTNEELIQLAQDAYIDWDQMDSILATMQKNVTETSQTAKDVFQNTPDQWPTNSKHLTSNFGYRRDPMTGRAAYHAGVDISGRIGDPVYAAADGKVITAATDRSRGKYIVVEHTKGYQTWYLHLNKISIKEGERITKGDQIGQLGNTGRSTGPHLHFQIVKHEQPIDPLPYIL